MLLQKLGLTGSVELPQLYMVVAGAGAEPQAFKLAESLRDAWPQLRLQYNLGGGNFKSQFKRADKSGAAYALVLGEDEMARGVVAIKDLRAGRAQEECEFARASERIGVLLGLKAGKTE